MGDELSKYTSGNIEYCNEEGVNLLMFYLYNSISPCPRVIMQLLLAGIDSQWTDAYGQNCFLFAAKNYNITPEALHVLAEAGAQTTLQNIDKNTALHVTACSANLFKKDRAIKVIDSMISYGIDVNSRNIYGESPLLVAATYKYNSFPELAEHLLSLGANPNIMDNRGRTFITIVRGKTKNKQVVRNALDMLVRYGFDLSLLDGEDMQPLSKRLIKNTIVRKNIASYNCFAKVLNDAMKRKLKVKKAQNMMRGFYADVAQYMGNDVQI